MAPTKWLDVESMERVQRSPRGENEHEKIGGGNGLLQLSGRAGLKRGHISTWRKVTSKSGTLDDIHLWKNLKAGQMV